MLLPPPVVPKVDFENAKLGKVKSLDKIHKIPMMKDVFIWAETK